VYSDRLLTDGTTGICMDDSGGAEITRLLHEWQDGSAEAFKTLVPLVYAELHALASRHLSREWRQNHLQTTALVSESYVRLFQQQNVDWQNRGHFFAIAAQVMRRVLVDYARREGSDKRGGRTIMLPLSDDLEARADSLNAVDAIDLNRALEKLEQLDPAQGRIVELRFFGGLTVEETATVLGRSPATVKREWSLAKGWLYRELTGGGQSA
jgi:RNA polymerase sigma-70 factor (ECF subfamily)